MNILLILSGKLLAAIGHFLNLGSGSTWPGHIALSINKNFIKEIVQTNTRLKIILISGTNGKTTTGKLIQTILEKNKMKVFQNQAGANLLNGVASSLIANSDLTGKINKDLAIFEIDENTLPLILKEINNPAFILILNLFRDQLDRYGEVNTIAKKWGDAIAHLPSETKLILNADDPQIASLVLCKINHIGKAVPIPYRKRGSDQVFYFGLEDEKLASRILQHASDSTYCPNCGSKLLYSSIFYSHLGIWGCSNCKNVRPKLSIYDSPTYPLFGIYNRYNTLAAVCLAKEIGISEKDIVKALLEFKPAFGRQEILDVNGKKVQIFLSKNPTSFNESLRTIADLKAKNVLFVLNDRIPDGTDVSWVWDADTEEYVKKFSSIIIAGDRAFDMGLRIKYSYSSESPISKFQIVENLKKAIALSLEKTPKSETLYILPTYSAMIGTRKILTGRKIL